MLKSSSRFCAETPEVSSPGASHSCVIIHGRGYRAAPRITLRNPKSREKCPWIRATFTNGERNVCVCVCVCVCECACVCTVKEISVSRVIHINNCMIARYS